MPEVSLRSGIREAFAGVPPVLLILYVGMGLALIGHMFYIWLGGISH